MNKADATAELVALGIAPRGLTRAQAAAYVGLAPRTFSRYVSQGKLPGAHPVTGRWDRVALDRAIGPAGTEDSIREKIEAAIENA